MGLGVDRIHSPDLRRRRQPSQVTLGIHRSPLSHPRVAQVVLDDCTARRQVLPQLRVEVLALTVSVAEPVRF